jgi:hypothetical protein
MTRKKLGVLVELLVARALNCSHIPSKGFDLLSLKNEKIEVRSRTVGTDGIIPRFTVNESKMNIADVFVGVQVDVNCNVIQAFCVPKNSLISLYNLRKQANKIKQAHLSWTDISALSDTLDITHQLQLIQDCVM